MATRKKIAPKRKPDASDGPIHAVVVGTDRLLDAITNEPAAVAQAHEIQRAIWPVLDRETRDLMDPAMLAEVDRVIEAMHDALVKARAGGKPHGAIAETMKAIRACAARIAIDPNVREKLGSHLWAMAKASGRVELRRVEPSETLAAAIDGKSAVRVGAVLLAVADVVKNGASASELDAMIRDFLMRDARGRGRVVKTPFGKLVERHARELGKRG